MSFTLYISPSQIETFTLESSVDGTITNESSVASKKNGTWRVTLTQGAGETITLSAPGFKTQTITIPTDFVGEEVALIPKVLYAWKYSGSYIYTATPNPTQSTLYYADFYDENGDNYGVTGNHLNGWYIGAYDTVINSADSSQITLTCYFEIV